MENEDSISREIRIALYGKTLVEDRMKNLKKESWIKNVLRIYPEKTREQAEELYNNIFVE
jgi:hypothetical protein